MCYVNHTGHHLSDASIIRYICMNLLKLVLKSYCTSLYCSHVKSDHKQSGFSGVRIGYNNVFRKLLKLQYRCCASIMFTKYNVHLFSECLPEGGNTITLNNNYICKYILWKRMRFIT